MIWREETHNQLEELENKIGGVLFPIDILLESLKEICYNIISSPNFSQYIHTKTSICKAIFIIIGDKAVYCEGSSVDQRINFAWAIHDAIDHNDRIKGLVRIAIMSISNKNNRDYVQIEGEEIEAVFDTLNCIGDIYPEVFKEIFLKNFLTSSDT